VIAHENIKNIIISNNEIYQLFANLYINITKSRHGKFTLRDFVNINISNLIIYISKLSKLIDLYMTNL